MQLLEVHQFCKKNQDFQICVVAYFIPFFLIQLASQVLIYQIFLVYFLYNLLLFSGGDVEI